MNSRATENLKRLGITLPEPPKPVAKYAPITRWYTRDHHNNELFFVSGQLPFNHDNGGKLITGKVGAELTCEEGAKAAYWCGVNVLSQLTQAASLVSEEEDEYSFDNLRPYKLTVMVNSDPDFYDHPKVADGCSELMASVFGDMHLAARSAFGVSGLPLNAAVEVEAIFGW